MSRFQHGDRVIVIFLGVPRPDRVGTVVDAMDAKVTVRFDGEGNPVWFNAYELRRYDPIDLLATLGGG